MSTQVVSAISFIAADMFGDTVALSDLTAEGPVVLVLLRGFT